MKRLIKKSDRLQVQQGNIDWKLAKGWIQENYQDLKIMTFNDAQGHFNLTIYRGTAAHPIANYYYRSLEQRDKAIADYKSGCDRRLAYKAEAKLNPTTSTAANCAKAIKEELTTAFPGVKFYVKSSTFAGGNSVHIDWQDGPTTEQVIKHTSKYQYGHFDGMQDMYEYSNRRDDLPQAKYVQESREMSTETRAILEASAAQLWESNPERFQHYQSSGCHSSGNFAYRVFQHYAIPTGAKVLGITETDLTSGSATPENFYCLDLELPKALQTKTVEPSIEPLPEVNGQINIIDYSEKAFAVVGDTKPIKNILSDLGGSFNARLRCGAGWIFSKKRLEAVQTRLQELANAKAGLKEEIEKTGAMAGAN
jgi:hypothetical protein